MTLDDIVALAKAGYTSQQISQLSAAAPSPSPSPSPSTSQATATETVTVSEQQPGAPTINDVLNRLNMLAIQQTQQPAPQTVDDVLASIINPPDLTGGANNA